MILRLIGVTLVLHLVLLLFVWWYLSRMLLSVPGLLLPEGRASEFTGLFPSETAGSAVCEWSPTAVLKPVSEEMISERSQHRGL